MGFDMLPIRTRLFQTRIQLPHGFHWEAVPMMESQVELIKNALLSSLAAALSIVAERLDS
jgi:hypothetical protein